MRVLIAPQHRPSTQDREPARNCCARCRRGTKAHGVLPCALALNCTCHRGDT